MQEAAVLKPFFPQGKTAFCMHQPGNFPAFEESARKLKNMG